MLMSGNKLFYDTETSGKYNFKLPPDHESQPHLIQLALRLTTPNGTPLTTFACLIEPEVEYDVQPDAFALHGIRYEDCVEHGLPSLLVTMMFTTLVKKAGLLVAHNESFDNAVLQTFTHQLQKEYPRSFPQVVIDRAKSFGVDIPGLCETIDDPALEMRELLTKTKRYCTMKSSTEICKLPGKFGKYKWPKLQEAYKHFNNEEFDGAHDALADVTACQSVYFAIQDE